MKKTFFLLFLLAFIWSLPANAFAAQTIRIEPVKTGWMNIANGNGGTANPFVNMLSNSIEALIKFDLSGIMELKDATITKATLHMCYVSNAVNVANANSFSNLGIYPTTNAAVDNLSSTPGSNGTSKITGDYISYSEPAFKNVAENAGISFETPVWYQWNVTNYVETNEAYSFVLAHKGSGILAQFGSLQASADKRPYLEITYEPSGLQRLLVEDVSLFCNDKKITSLVDVDDYITMNVSLDMKNSVESVTSFAFAAQYDDNDILVGAKALPCPIEGGVQDGLYQFSASFALSPLARKVQVLCWNGLGEMQPFDGYEPTTLKYTYDDAFLNTGAFKGILGYEKTADGLNLQRFTPAQFLIGQGNATPLPTTSGVVLNVMTDANRIEFDCKILRQVINTLTTANFDLLIDGNYISSYDVGVTPSSQKVALEIPGQTAGTMKEIKVVFPHSAEIRVKDFKLSPLNAQFGNVESKPTYLAIGDSITTGLRSDNPSSNYPFVVAESLGYNLVNQGISGDVYINKYINAGYPTGFQPDLITVALGTNDSSRAGRSPSDPAYITIEQFRTNVTQYFQTFDSLFSGTPTFVITPPWFVSVNDRVGNYLANSYGAAMQDIKDIISQVCSQYNYITVIEGLDIIGYDDIVDETDNPSWFGDKMSNDGVHPSTVGQHYYGQKLTDILRQYGY
ncbi:MAG: GDSL-type esterase/lipase family protein [Firmicutes bacterium]|nr:GDSL-type esterase/lipase family protein [Bacillota bacterium]